MSWFAGAELLVGIGALVLAVFLIGFFRFVPIVGSADAPPTQMQLTVLPLCILLIAVAGFALVFRSIGFI
jgi:hypothetical protein